jgi:outer membrane protein
MGQHIKSASNVSPVLWSISILALVLSTASLAFVLLKKQENVVSVDAAKLISKYKGVEEARKSLLTRNQGWQSNLDTLQRELQASVEDYKKNKATFTKRELKLMEELVQSKQSNLLNYEQSIKDQTKKQDEELAVRILAKINDYVKRYGKKKGYTIILAATQLGNVAFADETVDVTDEVLSGLNAEYQKVR